MFRNGLDCINFKKGFMKKEETKEQVMVIKISPELHKILEERAAKWGVSNAQYVRNAILYEAVMSGNPKAIKMLSGNLFDVFMQAINKARGSSKSDDEK